jgi:hypothetical protein
MGSTKIHGPKAKIWCRSTEADFGRQLVSTIPVDSGRILVWDRCHWKLYEILLPTIYRTSKSNSVCDLGVRFTTGCSWSPKLKRSRIGLGLHLGTRTGWALNLLVDLDTLFGLLLLHAMLPSWPYAWVPCPHQMHLVPLRKSDVTEWYQSYIDCRT